MLALSWCWIPVVAAASTEPITGLPLFPGATVVDTQPPVVACGRTIRGVQYESDETATKGVAFFRKALPGAGVWTTPAAMIITEFLAPNGKASVRVLGTPSGMYLVYGSFSKAVSMAQLRAGLKC
jgi:hypothetical protein